MQRLSGLDASFLSLETPTMHMHVASAAVFDPSGAPDGLGFERVAALVEERLDLLPPFRRRLVPVPLGLHHPLWVEDPDFDLSYHLRRASLPRPGGLEELAAFAADVIGRPLDRSKPLWEMWVVEGLEGGRVALVSKTHHAAIDGVSGAELTANLLDLERDPPPRPRPAEPWRAERIPSELEMLAYGVRSAACQSLALPRLVAESLATVLDVRDRNRTPGVDVPPAPFSAPRTSFNAPITAHRAVRFAEVDLERVRAVKRVAGTTVNDVVLALVAGSLRGYLAAREELPREPLVALVPVSVRGESERTTLGNRVSPMLVALATGWPDPVERLGAITTATRAAKDQERAIGAESLTRWADFAAPAVAARAARLVTSMRVFDRLRPLVNVIVSNVPGPPVPLYSAGAELVALYPMGPIGEGVGLNVTVMSYCGRLFFGLTACRELVDDLDGIAAGLGAELDALERSLGLARRGRGQRLPAAGARRRGGAVRVVS